VRHVKGAFLAFGEIAFHAFSAASQTAFMSAGLKVLTQGASVSGFVLVPMAAEYQKTE
jgi:hypothetical protein